METNSLPPLGGQYDDTATWTNVAAATHAYMRGWHCDQPPRGAPLTPTTAAADNRAAMHKGSVIDKGLCQSFRHPPRAAT